MEDSGLLNLEGINFEKKIDFTAKKINPFYNPILIITYQDILGLAAAFLGKIFLDNNKSPNFNFGNKTFNIFLFYAIISILFLICSIKMCKIINPNHDWYFYKKDNTYCRIVVLVTSFTIHFCLNYCLGQSEIIFKMFIEIEGFNNFWIEKLFIVEHTLYLLFYSGFYEKYDYLKIFQLPFYEFLINFFLINLLYDLYLSLTICTIGLIGCIFLNIGIAITGYYDNLEEENQWVGVLSIRYYQFIIFGYIGMLYYYNLLIFIFIALSGYKIIKILKSDPNSSDALIDRLKFFFDNIIEII